MKTIDTNQMDPQGTISGGGKHGISYYRIRSRFSGGNYPWISSLQKLTSRDTISRFSLHVGCVDIQMHLQFMLYSSALGDTGIATPKEMIFRGETIDFLEHIFRNNRNIKEEFIVALAWGIWKRRCEIINKPERNKKGTPRITLSKRLQ